MNKTIVGWLTMLACFAANIVNAVWGLCFVTYILLAIVTIGLVITFKMADPDDRKRAGKHVAYVVIAIVFFFCFVQVYVSVRTVSWVLKREGQLMMEVSGMENISTFL